MPAMKANANREQSALWNGSSGDAWAAEQALLDATFVNFERLLVDEVAKCGGRRVLDVGCGSGATTLAIAGHLASAGAVGIDISAPLVELARRRAARAGVAAEFLLADAQTHEFAGGEYDLAVSRFGVMFFDDPVAAFANLRGALRDGGALRAVAFRAASQNPFMTAAERAAAALLPNLPPRKPGPGQFALANREYVQQILAAAGWSEIALRPIDVPCAFAARELEGYFTRLGPMANVLRDADEATRARLIRALHAAFAPFVRDDEVRFDAACWMISATAPPSGR
jgi:ubiquinone/menaquinone biosynthesis C-methylase UbiE